MEDKNPINITSVIITFVIFLTGAALCFWLYTKIIQNPGVAQDGKFNKPSIDMKKYDTIKAPQAPAITTSKDGYGRSNPFVPYK